MSLINEMLRNLEANRPDDLARQNLQREIRSLPDVPPRGRALKLFLLLAMPSLGLGAAFLHVNGQLLPLFGMTSAPEAVVAVVPPTPVAVVAPPAQAAAVDVQPALVPDDLRLSMDIAVLPTPAVPVLAVPDPLPPSPARVEAVPAAIAPPESAKPVPAPPAGPVSIEKSPVLSTPRDRADAEYRRAENALSGGRAAEANEALRAALRHDPAYVQVRQALLRQLLEARKFDEATSLLHDGLELQPAQTGWAMSLARLQLEQGDLAAADRTLARSQAYAENSADYAGFQGHLKSRQAAHRQAAAHYLRATRLAPGEGRWWLGLGLALEADGRPGDAKDAFKHALATATLSAELVAVAEQHLR